ncbi:MAG TPA: hypothetical protein PLO67_05260 [Saprospiraceae bacterium]|nr:hypothetical protein [Saprospiraceae bacterium]HPI05573.1 hypothetical protein [Saprospiraceae bacterium]
MKKALLISLCWLQWAGLHGQTAVCTSFWKNGAPVTGTTIGVALHAPGEVPDTLSADGVNCMPLPDTTLASYPAGSTLTYSGSRDGDDLNGVNILDILNIVNYILGLYPLASPYGYFAADVNQSGFINGLDIIHIRRLIIGQYEEFPNSSSWRFFQGNCEYPQPFNPYINTCPPVPLEEILVEPQHILQLDGVKVGDLDGSAAADGSFSYPSISDSTVLLIPDLHMQAGVPTTVEIKLGGNLNLMGMQVEFLYDTSILHFNELVPTDYFPQSTYYAVPGKIKAVSTTQNPIAVPGDILIKLSFTANAEVQFPEVFVLNPSTLQSLGAHGYAPPLGIKLGSNLYQQTTGSSEPDSTPQLSAPSPNPFSEQTTFTIQLETPETVRLEVLDTNGKRLYLYENRLPAGLQALTIDQYVLSSGSIGYYRLQAGNRWSNGKLVRF